MKYYFSSDYHLGHFNIIKYCDRPFKTLDEMNNTIIHNHNQRVKKEDTVFYLGDFCFRNTINGKEGEGVPINAQYWKDKLNGNIVYLQGNHDKNNSNKTCIRKIIINLGGQDIMLCHNPEHITEDYSLNFCGHKHEKFKINKLPNGKPVINVGVDVWDFMPITYEEIWSYYMKYKRINYEKKR